MTIAEREATDHAGNARGNHDPGLWRARNRIARQRREPVASADVAALTLTAIVPAHNERKGLPETLRALLKQTMPPDRIIVVDDGSSDGTSEIASDYPVEIMRREQSSGSKSLALNHALPDCDTDIILNVDGDTVIGPDFVDGRKLLF